MYIWVAQTCKSCLTRMTFSSRLRTHKLETIKRHWSLEVTTPKQDGYTTRRTNLDHVGWVLVICVWLRLILPSFFSCTPLRWWHCHFPLILVDCSKISGQTLLLFLMYGNFGFREILGPSFVPEKKSIRFVSEGRRCVIWKWQNALPGLRRVHKQTVYWQKIPTYHIQVFQIWSNKCTIPLYIVHIMLQPEKGIQRPDWRVDWNPLLRKVRK